MSSLGNCKACACAAAAKAECHEGKGDDVVPVHKQAGLYLNSSCVVTIILVGISRADCSDESESQDRTCNEPSESTAAKWATDQAIQCSKALGLCGCIGELEARQDTHANINDKSPPEPEVELSADIRVPSSLWSLRRILAIHSPAFASVRVIVSVGVEEVGEYTIDNEIAASKWSLCFRVLCLFHRVVDILL